MRKCRHLVGTRPAHSLVRVTEIEQLTLPSASAASLTALCDSCAESLERLLASASEPAKLGGDDGQTQV